MEKYNTLKTRYLKYFFLGIGGIGMSALAKYTAANNFFTAGYDAVNSDITAELEQLGIKIIFSDNPKLLPDNLSPNDTLVILTPAIKQSNLLNYFKSHNFTIIKRAQFLAQIVNSKTLIAIAGTHGKTTTSAITAHIFFQANKLNSAFVGGITKNYNSNFIFQNSQNPFSVAEADEYDKAFLWLNPFISVITSIEPDHLDIYKNYNNLLLTFQQFAQKTNPNGKLIVAHNLKKFFPNALTFGFSPESDFFASDLYVENQKQFFTIHLKNHSFKTYINFPAKAYVADALAAAAAAFSCNIPITTIKSALQSYIGTKRRFDLITHCNNTYIYEDYAHHPTEITALFNALNTFYPNLKKTILFQPHLFSRTADLAEQFAYALEPFDQIIVTDIYPAREKPLPNISAFTILDKIKNPHKFYLPIKNLPDALYNFKFQILAVTGAGNINSILKPFYKNLCK